MTPVGYDRALVLMLRTASGKASASRLVNGIDVGESYALELFAEMVRRGHAQHLPGVWGGDWYELAECGIVAAAWVVCRDHVGLDAENVRDRNVELRLADDDAPSPTALQPIEGLRASDWLLGGDGQASASPVKSCEHPNIKRPSFDAKAAHGLSVVEVRKRWPRGHELCPDCRTMVITYASTEHYVLGDW